MKILLGTRDSQLALIQANMAKDALESADPDSRVELLSMKSKGDLRVGDKPDDKKEWIIDLEDSLLERKISAAVHSGKDVPNTLSDRTTIVPILKREDPRDVFLSNSGSQSLFDLPPGSIVGTSSLRRRRQILHLRDDIEVRGLRGNIPTRLRKVFENRECDAMVIAAAGLHRLKLESRISGYLDPGEFVPAGTQGVICVQVVKGSPEEELFRNLQDPETETAFFAERKIIEKLGADCHSALGVYVYKESDIWTISVDVHGEDEILSCKEKCSFDSLDSALSSLVDNLVVKGAKSLLF